MARHRCGLLCGSVNYTPFLDAALTFNLAALTRRQMQLSNAAALPLDLRNCLSMSFNIFFFFKVSKKEVLFCSFLQVAGLPLKIFLHKVQIFVDLLTVFLFIATHHLQRIEFHESE